MNKKKRKELLKLADGLLRVPEEQFRMSSWGNSGPHPTQKAIKQENPIQSDCGFAGCAIGWFKYLVPESALPMSEEISGAEKIGFVRYQQPAYGKYTDGRRDGYRYYGYGAIAKYFGIKEEEAADLFSPCSYPKGGSLGLGRVPACDVSKKILGFVERKDREAAERDEQE